MRMVSWSMLTPCATRSRGTIPGGRVRMRETRSRANSARLTQVRKVMAAQPTRMRRCSAEPRMSRATAVNQSRTGTGMNHVRMKEMGPSSAGTADRKVVASTTSPTVVTTFGRRGGRRGVTT